MRSAEGRGDKRIRREVGNYFSFYIGVYSVVIVSGGRNQNDSVLFFFEFFSHFSFYLLLSRVPCAIHRSLMTLCFKHIGVYTSVPNSLTLSLLFPPTINSFSKSVNLFLFCK